MKNNFHQRTFALILSLSVINGVGVLANSLLAAILGVFVAIIEIQIFSTYEVRWQARNLLIAIFTNTVTTYILLCAYCTYFVNSLCERNLLVLSSLPGFVLTLYWLTIFVASLFKKRK